MMTDKPEKKISPEARFVRLFVNVLIWPGGRIEINVPPVLIPVEWIFNAMPYGFKDRIFREIGWIVGEELTEED
jgi:hypothetical protein